MPVIIKKSILSEVCKAEIAKIRELSTFKNLHKQQCRRLRKSISSRQTQAVMQLFL